MTALRAWVSTRVALAVLVFAGAHQLLIDQRQGFLDRWDSWDVSAFISVAQYGYRGYPAHYPNKDIVAYFPGFPLVLRLTHTLIPDWRAAGLAVSAVAGGVAVLYLKRLGEDVGDRAVLYLVLSPYAVFLAAGYSEALFLGFALPGWYAARQGRWPVAAVLVALACTVRISGAFLAIGLIVEWATTSRDRRELPWLAAPFLALFGYAIYLHHLSGDWLRWQHAQASGWGRHLTDPLTSLRRTLEGTHADIGAEYRWSFGAEIAAVAVGLLVTVVLVKRRSWGEATYVGLSVAALATSSYYLSIARATLVWFPLWILLAEVAAKRDWVHHAYLMVAPALMVVAALTFTNGHWIG